MKLDSILASCTIVASDINIPDDSETCHVAVCWLQCDGFNPLAAVCCDWLCTADDVASGAEELLTIHNDTNNDSMGCRVFTMTGYMARKIL